MAISQISTSNTFAQWLAATQSLIAFANSNVDVYNTANSAYTTANSAYTKANTGTTIAQGAYDKANAANTLAQTAFNRANASFSQANNAYTQANTGTTLAQSAYNKANSANSLAQFAYDQAAVANIVAQGGFDKANSGFNQANTAYNQANTAFNQANTAYNQANTGTILAQAGFDQANAAYGQANTAYNQANTAFTQANTAFDRANTGFTQANTAFDRANTGFTQANTAFDRANTAYTQANTAYTQANTAFNRANGAFVQANAAFDRANTDVTSISVSAGTYGAALDIIIPVVTVTANGRVSTISNTRIRAASTTQNGIVQLENSVTSTSTANAATPASVKTAYDLASTDVTSISASAGTYGAASDIIVPVVTVTANGRVSSISNTTIRSATTTQAGVVQLENSATSTSTANAATPASVKVAYDLASTDVTNISASAGTYGAASDIIVPVVTVTANGRVSSISNTTIRSASTTQTGIVQLENSVTSTSTANAATPAAVKTAYDLANTDVTNVAAPAGTYGAASDIIVPVVTVTANGRVSAISNTSIRTATTTQTGIVQLENSVTSTSTANAATPASVKTAYDLASTDVTSVAATAGTYGNNVFVPTVTVAANGRVSSITTTQIRTANLTQTGLVQLENSVTSTSTANAATPASVKTAYDLASTDVTSIAAVAGTYGAASDIIVPVVTVTANGRVSAISNTRIRAASTTQNGIVQLENSVTSTSTANAAVPASVKTAYDAAITAQNTGQAAFNKANTLPTNTFTTIAVSGQSTIVAGSNNDLLTLAAGAGVSITTNAITDTITFSVSATQATAQWAADQANSAFNQANGAFVQANLAFDRANTDVTSIAASAGTYGSNIVIPTLTVEANGRISTIVNTPIRVANTTQTGVVLLETSVTSTSTANAATPASVKSAYDLASTDVTSIAATAGTYGNNVFVPTVTVTANGRVSSITTTQIRTANLTQTGLVQLENSFASTSTANAATPAAVKAAYDLASTDVTGIAAVAGTYGAASDIIVPVVTVTANGRVSSISNTTIRSASTTQTGVVLLETSVTSTSTANAATPASVKTAYDLASTDVTSISASAGTYGNNVFVPTVTVTANGRISSITTTQIRTANLTQTGLVQLENSVTSTSTANAATPASVKTAYDLASTDVTGVSATAGTYGAASDIIVPVVTVTANGRVSSISNTTIRSASTTQSGIVLLENSVTSTSTANAATPSAVKTAYDLAISAYNQANTGSQKVFSSIVISGQPTVNANTNSDTLTLVAGNNTTLTANSITNSITISSTGGSGTGNTAAVANTLAQRDASADLYANNFISTSDIRLKTDIHTIENALDIVNRLRGVRFKWKESGGEQIGLIAQEVELVLPEIIFDNGMKNVNYPVLVSVLIEAVKELTQKVSDLEKKSGL